MRSSEVGQAEERKSVRCRLDAFLQVDNVGAGMLAKTFQPLVGAAADHNFQETARFLAALNRAAELNQTGVRQMADRLDQVEEADREEFTAITDQLAAKAAVAVTPPSKVNSSGAVRENAQKPPVKRTTKTSGKPTAKVAGKPRAPSQQNSAKRPSSRREP
jgi:hypothetical protein